MSVYSEAAASDKLLVELDPYIEMDLALVINAFEKANKQQLTEDGILASIGGSLNKQSSILDSTATIIQAYPGMNTQPSSDELQDIDSVGDYFATCFPCDIRVPDLSASLPNPDFLLDIQSLLDQIEAAIDQVNGMLDPAAYYGDICLLIDALRLICPQDLVMLIAMLNFLIAQYLMMALQIDFDWLALVGPLLIPLLMLFYTLVDIALSMGVAPLQCLHKHFEAITALLAGVEDASLDFSASADINLNNSELLNLNIPVLTGNIEFPVKNEFLDDSVMGTLSKLSSFETMLVGMTSIEFRGQLLGNNIKRALKSLIELFSGNGLLSLQISFAMMQIVRLIAFITAILELIQTDNICTDPTKSLTSEEIEGVLKQVQDTSVAGDKPILSSSIELALQPGANNITISNTSDQSSITIPMCLGAMTSEQQDLVNNWIAELDALS